MSTKQLLTQFFKARDNYTGNVSCRKVKSKNGVTFYSVETDGNTFDAVAYEDVPNVVFYHGSGVVGNWICTDSSLSIINYFDEEQGTYLPKAFK